MSKEITPKLRKQINVIYQRSRKHNREIGGIIHNGKIIQTVKGGKHSVILPYNKKYVIYFHTHLIGVFFNEEFCDFHLAAPPSVPDLMGLLDPKRIHTTEYIFTSIGYYKITNPNLNIYDDLTLDALKFYYALILGLFQVRDNCNGRLMQDIQFFINSINTIDLSLIPHKNSLEGKAAYLFATTDRGVESKKHSFRECIDMLKTMEKKKFVKVEFVAW